MTNKTILSVAIGCILWGSLPSVFAATTAQPATTTTKPVTTTKPATTTTTKPATTTTDKPATTTTDKPATTTTDKPATTTTDKPATTTTDKPATTTTDKPATTPTDKPATTTTDKPATTTTDKPATTPTDKPATTPTDKPATTTTTDKPATTTTDKPATTTTDKPATTTTDKPATTPTDKPATTPTDKPATTPTDKPATTPTDKPATTPTDKPATTKPEPVKPKLEDFGLTAADVPKLDADKVKQLPAKAFGAFEKQQLRDMPAEAFAGLKPTQLAALPPDTISVLKPEQVDKMPASAMLGLSAAQIALLPTAVLRKLPAANFKSIDTKELQALSGKDLGKLLSSLDVKLIQPQDVKDRLPAGWSIDDNGRLTPPAGTVLTLKIKSGVKYDTVKVSMPSGMPDLNGTFALGSETVNTTNTILTGLNESLKNAGYKDFTMTQQAGGALAVEGSGTAQGTSFSFLPAADSVTQVAADVPSGLTQDATGHFVVTTLDKQQVTVIPTPKDPQQVAETLGAAGALRVDKNGVAILEIRNDEASPKQVRPVVFDPLVSQATDGKTTGIYVSDKSGEIVYADGTAQKIMPTAPLPDKFIAKAETMEGVESVQLNANGSFSVKYKGQMLQLRAAKFDAAVTPIAEGGKVATAVVVQGDGTVKYTVQDGTDQLDVVLDITE